ncbi:MAG: tetratricopeptide repeat protein [Pseudomonadota bacterium]
MGLFSGVKRLFASGGEAPATVKPDAADHVKRGVALLEESDFAGACTAFRAAVELSPGVSAHHVNLAYALQQAGEEAAAVPHLRQAASLDPSSFDAHYMLGGALERLPDLLGAAEHLRRAIALQPAFEPAHADLCRVLSLAGDTEAARGAITAAIALNPENADFHHYLGNLCMTESDAPAALESYERAIALRPAFAQVHANMGWAHHALKRFDEAIDSYERALAIDPSLAEAHLKTGLTRKAQRRLDDADTALQRAVDLQPDNAEALNHLGIVQQERGQLDSAIQNYRRAIALRPELPGGYANLGLALYEQGDVVEAIVTYRKGLAIKPIAEMHDNLATALQKRGLVDEAIEHYHLAIALQPDNLNTRCNLAAALAEGGEPQQAIAAYRQILELHPRHMVAHSNLLLSLSVDERCSPAEYLAEARRFDSKLATNKSEFDRPDDIGRRRLRIGFVSGDLRGHPVGYFLEGVLRCLDLTQFELFAYPTIAKHDELTARIRPLFAGWRLLKGLDDAAAAKAIRADGIDILLDLAGHSGENRLPLFGLRPAPVQVSWLGYFASTGVSAIDYVLADDVCVPPGSEQFFTERVWRLPETRLCFTPPAEGSTPEVTALPALRNGHITFGCFQRLPKINDAVLDVWGRVFAALPNARLLLQSHQTGRPLYAEQISARLEAAGISRDRATVRGPAPRDSYLESYGEVDIVLDTFPYTGGTTTCEALWMGVPTITLTGESMIARQGVAMMSAARLPDWVAADAGQYVGKAVAFGTAVDELAQLRATLRQRIQGTPLFDIQLFAHRLGAALTGIWREHAVHKASHHQVLRRDASSRSDAIGQSAGR